MSTGSSSISPDRADIATAGQTSRGSSRAHRRVSVPVAVRCIGGPPGTRCSPARPTCFPSGVFEELACATAVTKADAAYLRPRAKPRPYPPRTATARPRYTPPR
jgi:hypothetical protein